MVICCKRPEAELLFAVVVVVVVVAWVLVLWSSLSISLS